MWTAGDDAEIRCCVRLKVMRVIVRFTCTAVNDVLELS